MLIRELHLSHFRNLAQASLEDLDQFNLIHGRNGSGKTSILEAIHMLSLTRSFRSRQVESIIQFDSPALVVRALLDSGGDRRNLGIQRGKDKSLVLKYGGERLRSFTDLSGLLPVQLINPDSFMLLEGAPAVRRQFLDWSVFHVKHLGFYQEWSRYRKALKQRNALLRRGKLSPSMLAPWEEEIALTGAKITAMRRRQFELTEKAYQAISAELLASLGDASFQGHDVSLSMRFSPGWDDREGEGGESALLQILEQAREQDARQGFTRVGPHRADIRFSMSGLPAQDVLSRGQIKTVVCALKLAQAKMLIAEGLDVALLLDDLPAELDRQRRAALFSVVSQLGAQVFATSIDESDLDEAWFACAEKVKRFHVEHCCRGNAEAEK
ncbi:DNA replication/repair protein RecF [Spongiibacter tropicus]|uniref:DNA replication/repair protein RecF n=1 Tax=Spongiibacter tropicus TaxID=454602 RepID=UPI003A9936A0